MAASDRYIPALRFHWLTPFYDFALSRLMDEQNFKRRLVAQAGILPGMHVLDLGCGTGTLTIMIKQAHPGAHIAGLDADARVLRVAEEKSRQVELEIEFTRGYADRLPYSDGYFQRILSSLVIHHLNTAQKQAAFTEAYRTLEVGGELHLLDFGPPFSRYGRILGPLLARLEEGSDNINGALAGMIASAGFKDLHETRRFTTLFGDIHVWMAFRSQ